MTEHRDEAKAVPCTTETRTNGIRRGGGGAPCCLHCLSSRSVQHHTERSPSSAWFLQWGKQRSRWTSHSPSIVDHCMGTPTSGLPHRDGKRALQSLTAGNGNVMEQRKGLPTTSMCILEAECCLYHPNHNPS